MKIDFNPRIIHNFYVFTTTHMPNSFSGNVSFTSSIDPNVLEEILNQKLLENSFEKQLGTLNRLIYDPNMSVWLEHLTRATQVLEIQYFTFLCFQAKFYQIKLRKL